VPPGITGNSITPVPFSWFVFSVAMISAIVHRASPVASGVRFADLTLPPNERPPAYALVASTPVGAPPVGEWHDTDCPSSRLVSCGSCRTRAGA
jgi:hypothetical protein